MMSTKRQWDNKVLSSLQVLKRWLETKNASKQSHAIACTDQIMQLLQVTAFIYSFPTRRRKVKTLKTNPRAKTLPSPHRWQYLNPWIKDMTFFKYTVKCL